MSTARFDLTDMRLFVLVVEHGSVTRGAQAIHLALPSASERISGMESELGTALLERTPRGVHPTPAGQAFVRHARLILGQLEQMRGDLRTYATGLKGRIRVLSNTAALATFVPHQLARFLAACPDVSVDIDERPSAEIAVAIAEGRAEFGIVADIADLTALQTRLIAQDRLVVVANKLHRISPLESISFANIVDDDFVGLSDAALETHLAEHASRLGRRMHYRARLRGIEHLELLIEASVGIAVLPEACAARMPCHNLSILPLSEPWAFRQLYVCARDFATLTPHARSLAQQLIESVR